MDPRRSARVSETLREELEELIGYEMSDPRIEAAGVTEVLISPDARKARVRLSLSGTPEQQAATLDALNGARAYIRREMTRRLDVFRVPDLHFEAAMSADLTGKLDHLLRRVRRGRPRDENTSQKNQVE